MFINYALKSVVKCYNHYESPVYTCFLDASKAFDRINHWTPFSKLISRGVPCTLVRINMLWYRTQKVCVKWGKLNSSYFGVSNGVIGRVVIFHQNCSLSTLMNCQKSLSAAKTGCIINEISVNHAFYKKNDRYLLSTV